MLKLFVAPAIAAALASLCAAGGGEASCPRNGAAVIGSFAEIAAPMAARHLRP